MARVKTTGESAIAQPQGAGYVEHAFRSYSDAVYKRLWSKCRDSETAKDLTQTVFLKLAAHKAPETINDPKSYVMGIAQNVFFDHCKELQGQKKTQENIAAKQLVDEHTSLSPEDLTLRREHSDKLVQIIERLPRRRRESLLAVLFSRKSKADIAARLGVTKKTLRDHVYLALIACEEGMKADEPPLDNAANGSCIKKSKRNERNGR